MEVNSLTFTIFLLLKTLVCELYILHFKVMIYSRRIDLPKEVLHVADENLRGTNDVFVDKKKF